MFSHSHYLHNRCLPCTRSSSNCFIYTCPFNPHSNPILQMRKVRHKAIKQFAKDTEIRRFKPRRSNSGLMFLAPKLLGSGIGMTAIWGNKTVLMTLSCGCLGGHHVISTCSRTCLCVQVGVQCGKRHFRTSVSDIEK